MGLISWLIVGAIAGWLASIVMGTNERQGCIVDIIVGIVGALIGGFLLGLFGVGPGGITGFNIGSLITAFIGAVVLLFLWRQFATRT
ncbi:MAG: GlsB/YeaQ/YmgE family stress response membrane protein [Chloroflexota bacterium]|nr:GlsB/YeaQ/YmgE family stress response membrane protein [Chloroflexota bacterium]